MRLLELTLLWLLLLRVGKLGRCVALHEPLLVMVLALSLDRGLARCFHVVHFALLLRPLLRFARSLRDRNIRRHRCVWLFWRVSTSGEVGGLRAGLLMTRRNGRCILG